MSALGYISIESSSTLDRETLANLNKTLNNNKKLFKLEVYNNKDTIEPTNTTNILGTLLTYSLDLKLLFCSGCKVNLFRDNYSKHLKKFHYSTYNDYRSNNKIEELKITIDNLVLYTTTTFEANIPYNTYYIKDLKLDLNGFKCEECFYIHPAKKRVREHFNRKHLNPNKHSKSKASYIIDKVPLQLINLYKNDQKYFFIPLLPSNNNPIAIASSNNRNTKATRSRSRRPTIESSSSSSDTDTDADPSINKDLILSKLREESNIELDMSTSNNSLNNTKLLSSFIKISKIYDFLRDKDRAILVNLIKNKDNTDLEVDILTYLPYTTFEKLVIKIFDYISSRLPKIRLGIRQRLRQNSDTNIRNLKDFIALVDKSTKTTYYGYFGRLLTFVFKVYFIRSKEVDAGRELEYYNTIKDLEIIPRVKELVIEITNYEEEEIDLEGDIIDTTDNRLFELTIDLFSMLLETTYRSTLEEDLSLKNIVVAFFYINAIDPKTLELNEIDRISKTTSITIYNSRIVAIGKFLLLERGPPRSGTSIASKLDFIDYIPKYLGANSNNYFESITNIRPYLLALNKRYKSEKYSLNEVEEDIIEYNSIKYPIKDIKLLYTKVYSKLEDILLKDLLRVNSIDDLEIDFDVNDSVNLDRIGRSLIDNIELADYKDPNPYFLDKLLTKGTYYNKTLFKRISRENIIEFNRKNIEKFTRNINRFLEYLIVIIYISSGGPLRGSELPEVIYKNIETKRRSIIYSKSDNTFSITTTYKKTYNITRDEAPNLRYIPPNLSRLLFIYLVIIVPFKDYIYRFHFRSDNYSSAYLFTRDNKPITANTISRVLKKESSTLFDEGLTIESYRRIINYIIKIKLETLDYSSSEDSNDDLIEDKQANRSTRTSLNHYLNIGNTFNNLIPLDITSGIKKLSIKFWNYFNLLAPRDIELNKSYSRVLRKALNREALRGNNTLLDPNIQSLETNIKRLYNNNSYTFKNKEQKEAILTLVKGSKILTYINATSSGKSLLYLLLSFSFKSRLYIIITPRINLTKDLYQKAIDLKLNPSLLKDTLSTNSNLVFINIEDLNSPELEGLLNLYIGYNRDITIFLDEIHLLLLERTYRLKLKYLTSLSKYKATLVFVSATLPIALLNILEDRFRIKDYNKVIRGSSNRPSIEYIRRYYREEKQELEIVKETLEEINNKELTTNNKVLIFVTDKSKGEYLKTRLGVDFLYSTLINKDELLDTFYNSSSRALITTSLLEVGIDYSLIKYTIILEPIYSITSIIQSSGRIRDEGTAYLILKEPSKYKKKAYREDPILKESTTISTLDKFKELDRAYYRLLTIEDKCLRLPISFLFDNSAKQCSRLDKKCSICLDNDKIVDSLATRETTTARANNNFIIIIEEKLLEYYNFYCFYCLLDPYTSTEDYKHPSHNCPLVTRSNIPKLSRETEDIVRKFKLVEANTACYRCLLPLNICSKFRREYNLDPTSCFITNYLYNTIAIFYTFKDTLLPILDSSIISTTNLKDFTTLLLKRIELNSLRTINLIVILYNLDISILIREIEDIERAIESDPREDALSTTSSRSPSPISQNRGVTPRASSVISNRDISELNPEVEKGNSILQNLNKGKARAISISSESSTTSSALSTRSSLSEQDNNIGEDIPVSNRDLRRESNRDSREEANQFNSDILPSSSLILTPSPETKQFRRYNLALDPDYYNDYSTPLEDEALDLIYKNRVKESLNLAIPSTSSRPSSLKKRYKNLSIDIRDSSSTKGNNKKAKLSRDEIGDREFFKNLEF